MKILFMGTPEPAAKCLEALINSSHKVVAVITQPDRPKGRGLNITASAVKELALKNQIPVYQPEKIKDKAAVDLVRKISPDLIVVAAYGKILPKDIIDFPKHGSINVHASLLPKYRGAAPIQRGILNGEKETGITIQKVFEALDTGDIILQEKVPLEPDDNAHSLTIKLFVIGSELLVEAVDLIEKGRAQFIKQDEKQATYAAVLKKEDGIIDWKKSSEEIFNMIRALGPWPGAFTYYKGKALKILAAEKIEMGNERCDGGKIIDLIKQEGFIIGACNGQILVKKVQPESGKAMSAYQFALGHKIQAGDILPS